MTVYTYVRIHPTHFYEKIFLRTSKSRLKFGLNLTFPKTMKNLGTIKADTKTIILGLVLGVHPRNPGNLLVVIKMKIQKNVNPIYSCCYYLDKASSYSWIRPLFTYTFFIGSRQHLRQHLSLELLTKFWKTTL